MKKLVNFNNKYMEKKYYTPSIEEFQYRFEYEVNCSKVCYFGNTKGAWTRDIFIGGGNDVDGLEIDAIERALSGLDEHIQIRVKFLDREDIESFGFIYSGKTIDAWYTLNKTCQRPLSDYDNRSFVLRHDFREDQGVVIKGFEYISQIGREENLYTGACKNKFELKKLLKNLNILD